MYEGGLELLVGRTRKEIHFSVPIPPADSRKKCIFEELSSLPHSHCKVDFLSGSQNWQLVWILGFTK